MRQSTLHFYTCIFLMTLTVMVMFGFGRNVMVVMWPEILARFSIDYAEVGNLAAVHQGAYFLASLAAGRLAIRVRPELIVFLSTVLGGVLIMLMGHIEHSILLFLLYGALGALIALSWVPMVRYAALSMDRKQRVTALGTAACGTAIGFLVNGFVVPVALERFGMVVLWSSFGGATIIVGALTYAVMLSFHRTDIQIGKSQSAADAPANNGTREFPTRVFCAFLFFCGVGLVSFQTYYSAYLVEDLQYTEAAAGKAWILPGLLGAFSGIALSFAANRSSIKTTILVSLIVLGGVLLVLALGGGTAFASVAATIYSVLYFGLFGLFPAYLTNVVSDQAASRIYGRANLFLGVGSMVGGITGGKIAHHFGSFEPFWVFTTVCVVVALVLLLRIPSDRAHS